MFLGKSVRKTIALLALPLMLLCTSVVGGNAALINASAASAERTQSSFIGDKNGVQLTENYAHATLDSGKSGLLVESVKTGKQAEGSGFTFANEMSGTFSLDYRVFSTQAYAANAIAPSSAGSDWNSDELNPYCDLRNLSITVTDSVSEKSFTIYQQGATKYALTTTMFSVATEDMSQARGYKYPDWEKEGDPTIRASSSYKFVAYGTSFSNRGYSSSGTPAADGGISSTIEFDPMDMKVYAWLKTPTKGYRKQVVIDLADPLHVGEGNELSPLDFTQYSVSVQFDRMLPDDYTDSLITQAYARRAQMIIYSVNGQSLAGQENGDGDCIVTNTAGAIGLPAHSTTPTAGEEFSLSFRSFDVLDGYGTYNGDITYYTSYDPTEKTLTAASGYKLTVERYGILTVKVPGIPDSGGLVGGTNTYTYQIKDLIAPVVTFSDTLQSREFFDIEGIKNSILRPIVSKDDICVTVNDDKTYSVNIKVLTPKGVTHTDTTASLPFNDLGLYTVTYVVTDVCGNVASIARSFSVNDYLAPQIILKTDQIVCKTGERINLTPFSITDNCSANNAYTCTVYKNGEIVAENVEAFIPADAGEYTVAYKAQDGVGNEGTAQMRITVVSTTPSDYSGYIVIPAVIAGVALIAGVVIFFLSRKKGVHNE